MASQAAAPQLRSFYRRLLRELPSRQPSSLANPSPIQQRIRSSFATPVTENAPIRDALDSTEQFIQYLKAQRVYTTLIERYNPGMNMADDDRVRLTARRVGMDLPDEYVNGGGQKGGSGGNGGR